MRLEIAWAYPALVTFYALRVNEAAAIDRAVIRLAETGDGDLAYAPPYYRLRTGAHDALLAIDHQARKVTVLGIRRAQ